jgi:hypothetical protein
MRRFHIVCVTRDLAKTLVIETAAGWLLPWLDDNPTLELPEQVQTILRPLVASIDIVHEAPLPDTVTADQIVQGYCLVVTSHQSSSSSSSSPANSKLVANSELSVRPALLRFQHQAWLLAMERLHAPIADFDSVTQVEAALEWVARRVAECSRGRVQSIIRHRCSRHEYVARLDTTSGTMYFKGGVERVADEGVLTALLHALDATIVPETLAIDVGSGRWIYRELPGSLMAGSSPTMSTVLDVVSVLTGLQKRAVTAPAVRDQLRARCLTAVDLFEAADRTIQSVFARGVSGDQNVDDAASVIESWRSEKDEMFERCLGVDRIGIPRSLAFSDFWSRNILQTPGGGIGFIDLERCYWSYPFLPLWRLGRDVEDALETGGVARARIESAFVTAWSDVVAPSDMTTALAELPLLGRLFALLIASREIDLRERDLGSPLPPQRRAPVLLRQVRRLLDGLVNHA